MLPDILKLGLLFGAGVPDPDLLVWIGQMAHVQVVGQSRDPTDYLAQKPELRPDVLLVHMGSDGVLPEWLDGLTSGLPQTAVLLCSPRLEPEFLLAAMRLGVREVLPLPLQIPDLEQALERVRHNRRRLSEVTGGVGRIVTITGSKGGVGATTVAVNLAVALSRAQKGRVVLVDLGRPYPDVGHFLDRESTYTILDLIQNQANLDQAFLEKTIQVLDKNLAMVHGMADFADLDAHSLEGLRKVLAILKAHYRWVVVDLGHWLDEVFLQVVQDSDVVFMLLSLTVPELRNLAHLWPALRNYLPTQEKVKLVINQYDRSNGLSPAHVEEVLKQKPFFRLPSEPQLVIEAINRGVPLVSVAPKSKLWLGLEKLAHTLSSHYYSEESPPAGKVRRRFWIF